MIFGKKMSKQELGELREINKVLRTERFKAYVVSRNSYKVFHGQNFLKTQNDLIALLEEEQNHLISSIGQRLGIEVGVPIEVDLKNGSVRGKPKPADESKQEEIPEEDSSDKVDDKK